MSMVRIAVLDTETTGLDPETCEVVEIGCTIIDVEFTDRGGFLAYPVVHIGRTAWNRDRFETYIDPGMPIPPEVSGIHHIIDEDLVGAPGTAEGFRLFEEFLSINTVDLLCAHNAKFDRAFVDRHFEALELPWICSRRLAQRVFPDAPGYSNQTLRYWLSRTHPDYILDEYNEIDRHGPVHRALFDTQVTAVTLARIFHELRFICDPEDSFAEQLSALSEEPILLREVKGGKYKGTLYADLPWGMLDFLRTNGDEDVQFTAEYYIAPERYVPRPLEALSFGAHKDKPIALVPTDYLNWIVDKSTIKDPDVLATALEELFRRATNG